MCISNHQYVVMPYILTAKLRRKILVQGMMTHKKYRKSTICVKKHILSVLFIHKIHISFQCYPENNLFTLKN